MNDLEQSQALSAMTMEMLSARKHELSVLKIILIISLITNIILCGMFIFGYRECSMVETTTVEQDNSDGNNVYQAGEYAVYTQEVINGETDNNSN